MSVDGRMKGGVQSLEIGLAVLDTLVAYQSPMMLKEISETLAMHPAKVHRYVTSLVRMKYAKQIDDGRYALGNQIWKIGLDYIQRSDSLRSAQAMIFCIAA